MRTDQDQANKLIAEGKTLVAAFDGRGLVDITELYRAMRDGRVRLTTLRTNDQMWSSRLGSGWYGVENGFRWMQRRATVVLDTPSEKASRLFVTVYCPRTLLDAAGGKLEMRAFAEGKALGNRAIVEGQQQLEFDELPAEMYLKKQLEIALEVSHVVVPPADGRELGVAVFEIAVKLP